MIYDRPVSELMAEAAEGLEPPISTAQMVSWFQTRYPKVKRSTVTAHLIGLTWNDSNRHHYPTLAAKPPLFFKSAPGTFERFDPDLHIDSSVEEEVTDGNVESGVPASADETQFVLESQLETFLLGNWNAIRWGRTLAIWQGEGGQTGHQFSTPVGRLDFLCIDSDTNDLVIVELKRGRPSDSVVGQVARYIGWVKSHLATPGQQVKGLIIAHDSDDSLEYAVSAIPGLDLATYKVSFELSPAGSVTSSSRTAG